MLKIRALNESHSSSESEDEENPRLSKEAQESQAVESYHEALQLKSRHDDIQALETFEKILTLPYLDEEENRTLSPMQAQVRLGCLKCLSSLYSEGSTKNLTEALRILRCITDLEPNNVNYWYRYGKIALENEDLYLSYNCFRRVLELNPGHWGSIDKLVTVSYVLHDFFGCLRYCSMGLNKDAGFEKGHVFSDYILTMNPWIKTTLLDSEACGYESLFPFEKLNNYEICRKDLHLNEARELMHRFSEYQQNQRREEEENENSILSCSYALDSPSFLELCHCVAAMQEYVKECGSFLRPLDLNGILSSLVTTEENRKNNVKSTCVNGGDEISEPPSLLRSRSSSDDKETIPCDRDNLRASTGDLRVGESDEKSGEEDSQTSNLQVLGQTGNNSGDEESSQKKKSKKGMKWWQMEGKRRSQRVRGNLTPVSPTKPKADCFLDTLKNVIPGTLIYDDISLLKDEIKPLRKDRSSSNSVGAYFGSPQEAEDVVQFLESIDGCNIISITTKLVRLLSKECKGGWPLGLGSAFLKLFRFYKSTVSIPNHAEFSSDMEDDAFVALTRAEIVSESISNEASPENYLFELQLNYHNSPVVPEYLLRKNWLLVKRLLHDCNKSSMTEYEVLDWGLNYLHKVLSSLPKTYVCFSATQEDYDISSAIVQDKINFVEKRKNLSKINELYQRKDYTSLVDLLEFSLIGGDESCGDVKNRMYLAESYYHLRKSECVEQCAKICDDGIKNRSDEILTQCISLLSNIWKELKETFSIKENKLFINIMIQVLTYTEKRNVDNEFLVTEPWCLLSLILLYLENKESAFYVEEDNVPNSVLVLQLGHDTLSANGKCCAGEGRLLSHTVEALLDLQNNEDYWSYEETKNCLEQAILCLYSHPGKKNKSRTLKDHGAPGVTLNWRACCQLYKYYKLDIIPEFDTYTSVSAEVESLFRRIIQEVPENLKPTKQFVKTKQFVEGNSNIKPEDPIQFETPDIYYLLADYYLKTKDFEKAVEYYVWDLAVCPYRFDSWAAVALAKAEDLYSKINSCDRFCIEEVTTKAEAVIKCFHSALDLEEDNCKVRVEFGSFLYSLHSVYSRELKFHTHQLSLELFNVIEQKKQEYLLQAQKWFEPYSKYPANSIQAKTETSQIEDVWINHYMLGKVTEKLNPNDPKIFLTQYELAGELLHAQNAPYPAKINYYSPPEGALEALEIYYRIHASVLSYLERCDDYDESTEQLIMSYLQRALESPFIKSKQGRGGEDVKKKKSEDGISKKETAVISALLKEMLDKVEEIMSKENDDSSSESFNSACITTEDETSEDESANTSVSKSKSAIHTNSVPASTPDFKDKTNEKDFAEVKVIEEAAVMESSKSELKEPVPSTNKPLECDALASNPFYSDFSGAKYGKVIAHCLQAMKECVSRYPQFFKGYYRLAYTYKHFKDDFKMAREYFMGNNCTGPKKITGLFGERKPNNFFHGIWRHPVDDIDRPGSFPFHMAKSIQLLFAISIELQDHQLLAELGIQLARVPDSHNSYLFTEDREQFSKEAINSCTRVAKKCIPSDPTKLLEAGTKIYDTYIKFQRHNPRENNIGPVLLQLYKQYAKHQIVHINTDSILLSDAVKFFQHMAWTSKTSSGSQKTNTTNNNKQGDNSKLSIDPLKSTASNLTQNPPKNGTIVKKPVMQRRVSDQGHMVENPSANLQFSGHANSTTTSSRSQLSVPSLFSTGDFQNMGMALPQFSSNALIAYASQFTNLFSQPQRTSILDDTSNTLHQQKPPPCSTNVNTTDNSDRGRLDKTPIARTSTSNSFRSDPRPVNDLLSNLSNAIAAQARSQAKQSELKQGNNVGVLNKKPLPRTSLSRDNNASMGMTGNMALKQMDQTKKPTQINRMPSLQKMDFRDVGANEKRSSSNHIAEKNPTPLQKQTMKIMKGPLQVARKSTGNVGGAPRNMYQNVNSRPYMTSSPYQAQTTALMTPSISGIQMKSSRDNSTTVGPPPAAHSHFKPRVSESSMNEPEVVDLTTKSPEKILSLPSPLFENRDRPLKRPLVKPNGEKEKSYPLPPKKKHHIMPLSPHPPPPPLEDNNIEVITIE